MIFGAGSFELRPAERLRWRSFEPLRASQDDNSFFFALRMHHFFALRFHTRIAGNRLRALDSRNARNAAAKALPMLMPNEPDDGFAS